MFWYVLCLVALLKGHYLTNYLRTNIFLIEVEVLRFLVCQCVVSFHSHFQYGLLPLLTPRSSDPSINAILGSCKQQHCYRRCLVDPPSSLLAAVTIVVKKMVSQQYYIFFLYFVCSGSVAVAARQMRRQRQQHGGGGQLGGGGSSLAEAQLWRQRQRVGKHGGSVAATAATWRWRRQHGVCWWWLQR